MPPTTCRQSTNRYLFFMTAVWYAILFAAFGLVFVLFFCFCCTNLPLAFSEAQHLPLLQFALQIYLTLNTHFNIFFLLSVQRCCRCCCCCYWAKYDCDDFTASVCNSTTLRTRLSWKCAANCRRWVRKVVEKRREATQLKPKRRRWSWRSAWKFCSATGGSVFCAAVVALSGKLHTTL